MKLYYAPGACSLSVHIALEEAGMSFEIERVDLKSKLTETGADFTVINPKGYVPALVFDIGEMLTENLAVLDWIATRFPALGLEGPLGRTRLLEYLSYLSSELHTAFKPLFHGGSEGILAEGRRAVLQKLGFLAEHRPGPYLCGGRPSVADFYLFVMLLWAVKFEIDLPEPLQGLMASMVARPAVQRAMAQEGLSVPSIMGFY
jgi:glutathione S-transferase